MKVDISALLRQTRESRFWGTIEIKFQDGKPILISKTETFKPDEGTTHEQQSNR